MDIDMQLILALVLSCRSPVNANDIANLKNLWTVLWLLCVKNARVMLEILLRFSAFSEESMIDYFQSAHVLVAVF
jgi:hypothetical protein